jgi:hypothetical protein
LELHDQKLKVDQEIQRAEAAQKYWKTHDFNIINCEHFDNDKEQDFTKTRQDKMTTHGKDQVKKLPISV